MTFPGICLIFAFFSSSCWAFDWFVGRPFASLAYVFFVVSNFAFRTQEGPGWVQLLGIGRSLPWKSLCRGVATDRAALEQPARSTLLSMWISEWRTRIFVFFRCFWGLAKTIWAGKGVGWYFDCSVLFIPLDQKLHATLLCPLLALQRWKKWIKKESSWRNWLRHAVYKWIIDWLEDNMWSHTNSPSDWIRTAPQKSSAWWLPFCISTSQWKFWAAL